jgi:ankyrin repeat protein
VKGHSELVNALLARPEIDIYQNLYLACRLGSLPTVKRLLQIPNINVNQRNETGLTPLMVAATNGKTDIVRVLMDDSRVEFEDTITLRASQLARISDHKTSADAIDHHPRSEQRMANRILVRRPIDQGQSGRRQAPIHIGHSVGSYFHHDVKTKLNF